MPSNNGRAEPTVRDYSYVSCGLEMMYEDGGGGGDGGGGDGGGGDDGGVDNRDDTDGNDSMSGGGGGGSNGSDLEDDSCSSWTEDTVSYAGTSTSDSSSSSNGIDDGNKATIKGRGLTHGDGGGNKGKWLRTLWTIIDRVDRGDPNGKPRPAQPVKTILRPPTTYKYVIGMSGFPSKVAVYPRRM